MPNIDETELARLEALAGKASLLPWANTDTAKELLNVEPDDWWKIYALNGPDETRFPYHVVCSMSQRATDEEMTAARKSYFYPDGDHIMRDPGKSGDNARYIAAACNAVPALVAEVRRLREALNTFIEEDQSRVILVQQQMLDVMREKVEAWEWWEEVRLYDPWSEHPCCTACGNRSKRGKIFDCAVDEYEKIKSTACEAVC